MASTRTAMSGFNVEQAISRLGVPEDFRIEAAVAVGRLGNPATLPDYLREREQPVLARRSIRLRSRRAFPLA